tara:strand:+ start:2154 stop:3575 length:1422 start_codon:yes stop_codon:yes gene_type:complete
MVYQHQLNEMLYKYFNETNQTMREFAEENTQLIAALSQEQDNNKQLKEENKQLIYTLSQELDSNKLLNLENGHYYTAISTSEEYSLGKKESDFWKQKYHELETQFQERLDKECKAKQLLLEKQFQERLATAESNHKEETDYLIHSHDCDMEDLQDAYEAVCLKNEQLKSHQDSPSYKELKNSYTSLIKDYASLQNTINEKDTQIEQLNKKRDNLKLSHHNDYQDLKDAHANILADKTRLQKAVRERNSKIHILEDKLRLMKAVSEQNSELAQKDSTTIEQTKKQRDDLLKKYSDLYYHTHNFVESISLEFSLDKTYQTEWSDRYINNDFLKTFMDYCTSAINNHQDTIHIIEEERDAYKTDFHLFLTDVIDRLTSPTDALRKLTFEHRDQVLEACKTCSGLLNVWDYHRAQTHSSYDIHLDNVSEISDESETPSQTSETEYTTHLDSVLTENKPLLDDRQIPEPTGEWVIPDC